MPSSASRCELRWLFVRHAESEANAGRWFSGHVDAALTDTGRQQARELGRRLAHERIQTVLSSDLRRAADTARLAFEGRALGMRVDCRLRERHIGTLERTCRDSVDLADRRLMKSWTGRPGGGESCADMAARAVPVLADPQLKGPVCVFAHGGLLHVLLTLAEGGPVEHLEPRVIGNTSTHVRELEPDHWQRVMERIRR